MNALAPEVVARIEAEVGLSHDQAEPALALVAERMAFPQDQRKFTEYLFAVGKAFKEQNADHISTRTIDGKEEIVCDQEAAEEFEQRVQGAADVAVYLNLKVEQVSAVETHTTKLSRLSDAQQDLYLRIVEAVERSEDQ